MILVQEAGARRVRTFLGLCAALAAVVLVFALVAAVLLSSGTLSTSGIVFQQNDFGDWDTVHHAFTAANALHHAIVREPTPELARGLVHGGAVVQEATRTSLLLRPDKLYGFLDAATRMNPHLDFGQGIPPKYIYVRYVVSGDEVYGAIRNAPDANDCALFVAAAAWRLVMDGEWPWRAQPAPPRV